MKLFEGQNEIKSNTCELSKLATERLSSSTIDIKKVDAPLAKEVLSAEPKDNLLGVEKDSANEAKETDVKGGSYRDVKKCSDGDTHEVHHMPADSASPLEREDGPAIKMEKEDHRQTASCGMSQEAREYRDTQKELINNGKFKEALQMDIEDIKSKFDSKYDEAIEQMLQYVQKLESEGKI